MHIFRGRYSIQNLYYFVQNMYYSVQQSIVLYSRSARKSRSCRTVISGTKTDEAVHHLLLFRQKVVGTQIKALQGEISLEFSVVNVNLILLRKINKRALFDRFSLRGFS